MAKIESSNQRYTPKGSMPPDKIKRFKLSPNLKEPLVEPQLARNRAVVKKNVEDIRAYRQIVHGVNEATLPNCFKLTAHYLAISHTRADSDNPKDRKGLVSYNNNEPAPAAETEIL